MVAEILARRDGVQRWLDHLERWTKYDASTDRRRDILSYARVLIATLRQMAWAMRGLDSRRAVEDLRNELLGGITFFGTVIANSRNEQPRGRGSKADAVRAAAGAGRVIATLASMDPELAERLRVGDVSRVILRRADLFTRVSGKRAPRGKDSGYLKAFAALWKTASDENVSPASIRTSFGRWRRYRSIKSAVLKQR